MTSKPDFDREERSSSRDENQDSFISVSENTIIYFIDGSPRKLLEAIRKDGC